MNFSLTRVRLTAAVLLALGVALLALNLLDVGGPSRLLLVVAFGLSAPGWAIVACLPPLRPALEWSTAVAFSMAASVLLGTAMLGLGLWRPALAFSLLLVSTCCLLTWHLLRPTPRVIGILEVADEVAAGRPTTVVAALRDGRTSGSGSSDTWAGRDTPPHARSGGSSTVVAHEAGTSGYEAKP